MTRPLRQRVRERDTLLGGFVFSTDPNITAIYAAAGFDFVIIDLEHTMGDVQVVAAHLRAAQAAGIDALVGIGRSQLGDVPRLLDAGCCGLMLPHVGLPSYGANEALRAMRYPAGGGPPMGTGVPGAGVRLSSFPDYVRRSNAETLSIGLVEDKACVDDIDAVLSGGLLDCVMPGPGDLSVSYGVHGQFGHPLVLDAIDRVLSAAQKRGVAAGLYIADPSAIAAGLARGFNVFVLSIDSKLLGSTLRSAVQCMNEHRSR